MSPNSSCFEIVHFAFRGGLPLGRQAELMKQLGEWASTRPGFVARQCYHDARTDRWTDIVESGR